MDILAKQYADRALDWAARFSLTHSDAVAIANGGRVALTLQLAMQDHIYKLATESYRAKVPVNRLLPSHIETRIGYAWREHGREFLEIANREYEAALNAREAA